MRVKHDSSTHAKSLGFSAVSTLLDFSILTVMVQIPVDIYRGEHTEIPLVHFDFAPRVAGRCGGLINVTYVQWSWT